MCCASTADRGSAERGGLLARPFVANSGRLALVVAVVFWWGGVVIPRLISLVLPEWLPPEAIPRDLNPDLDLEGRLANRVSAGALMVLAFLALINAGVSRRTAAGRIAVIGWFVLGVATGYLAWEEVSDFHVASIALGVGRAVFGVVSQYLWVILLSPLILVFVSVMLVFISKGGQLREVNLLLTLGILVWLLVLIHEVSAPYLFIGGTYDLEVLIEETLEFGGTLLIGLGAAIALRKRELGVFRRPVLIPLIVGSLAVVGLLGSLVGSFVFRAPVIDTRNDTHIGTFHVSLSDSQAVAQGFGMPAIPIGGFGLRLGLHDPEGRSGAAIWRIVGGDGVWQGPILRAGRIDAPAGKGSTWKMVNFPPLVQPEGRPLTLLVEADVGPGSSLLVRAAKADRKEVGRFWINGEPAWSDQTLSFVAYSASEPTRSKVQAIWAFMTSDWRWPVLLLDLALGLTLLTLIPALLIFAALRRPRVGGIPSELR